MKPCERLRTVLEKHFPFLTPDGFRVAYESEWGADGCVIGFEGRAVRVKFYTASDEFLNILVGEEASPFDRTTGKDGDEGWYFIRGIVAFIDQDLSVGERFATKTAEEILREPDRQASELAQLLATHLDEIVRLFAGGFDGERRAYEVFSKAANARTRAAYEAAARRH